MGLVLYIINIYLSFFDSDVEVTADMEEINENWNACVWSITGRLL